MGGCRRDAGATRLMFALEEHSTTVRTEVLGGATTFVTMAYIMVLNPAILSFAGIPVGPSTVATALAAAFGCLLMGFYANRPIAVAPYMGENAFIAFSLAATVTWQERLGSVFIAGALFLLLTLLRVGIHAVVLARCADAFSVWNPFPLRLLHGILVP